MRVLDLTRLVPGPYATLVLSDLGADVVKIEDPGEGDYLRAISPGMFAALNRGKRSAIIDLKSAAGRGQMLQLCAAADVLVESFRPGVLARLLGSDLPPRLVVCSLNGFGATGPMRDRAGHDIGYMAVSGALAQCPDMPALQIADWAGAFQVVIAILAALLERGRTGRGRAVEVSLSESAMQLLIARLAALHEVDVLDGKKPAYRLYRCAEGRYALGALEPKFWSRFCAAIGRAEWEARAFDPTLVPELDALFAQRTAAQWDELLREHDCCGEPVIDPANVATHPQVIARDLMLDGMLRTLPALVATSDLPRAAAPAHGQHTAEVLASFR